MLTFVFYLFHPEKGIWDGEAGGGLAHGTAEPGAAAV